MDLLTIILIAIIALAAGTLGNLAGFGGGIIIIPLIFLFFDYPLAIVVGSALFALIFPSAIGAIGAWRRNEINYKFAALFEVPTVIGTYIGARLTTAIPERVLQLIFGLFALMLTFNLRKYASAKNNPNHSPNEFWRRIAAIPPVIEFKDKFDTYQGSVPAIIGGGFIIGIFAGMLGVGGGWLKTPFMILGIGISPPIATGTALFMIVITALVGGLTHFGAGDFDFGLFLTLSIALSVGALIAQKLKPKINNQQLVNVISVTTLIVAIMMITNAFL